MIKSTLCHCGTKLKICMKYGFVQLQTNLVRSCFFCFSICIKILKAPLGSVGRRNIFCVFRVWGDSPNKQNVYTFASLAKNDHAQFLLYLNEKKTGSLSCLSVKPYILFIFASFCIFNQICYNRI